MRILYIIDSLRSGGKERRLTELIKKLRLNKDFQFEIVVMSNEMAYEEVVDSSIKIHFIIRKKRNDINAFFKFYAIIKNYSPDLVHCWDSMTAIYAIPACKILKIKLVNGLVVDCPGRQSIFNKYILRARISFLFSDLIIGNSDAGISAYSAPKRKSVVIHNGFDFNRTNGIDSGYLLRQELSIETKYIIGMVATFSNFKDYKTYYNAAALLLGQGMDITFLAVGPGTDDSASTELVEEKYRSHFRFLGKRSDIENIVNALDIGVLSTFTEGISNAILEYMALKKPVVATRGGGTSEIVNDKVTGFLAEPSNPQDLSDKIAVLLNDQPLRLSMGIAGKEKVMADFSIESMVSKYINYYHHILSKSYY